ncbi:hypothetical protein ABT040_43565 [Streptomyces sp. NPDC002688]|uniref:hypothetical protein n=1 Tax=Streptomyces sp. NPDC002688 TaxID=3154423 RepID=UPI00331DEC00
MSRTGPPSSPGVSTTWSADEFFTSAVGTGLSLVTYGQTKWLGAADKALGGKLIKPVVDKITEVAEGKVSSITKSLVDLSPDAPLEPLPLSNAKPEVGDAL